jgi:hypothetical protein
MPVKPKKWSRHVHVAQGALEGWCEKCPASKRRAALRRVAKEDGYQVAIRRLNFLRNVASRKTNAALSRVAGADLRWAERTLKPKRSSAR